MNDLYDPLTYENLMAGLVVRFEQQPRLALTAGVDALGPGIYALFYLGNHEAYQSISGTQSPIYVGKAVPPGSRKGGEVNTETPALQRRVAEHARSLEQANNLVVDDFECRYLTLVPVWITLAERFLIDHYQPVWNLQLDGFGNHDPGRGRRLGEVSWWDTLHPGRPWARELRQVKTEVDALRRIDQSLDGGL